MTVSFQRTKEENETLLERARLLVDAARETREGLDALSKKLAACCERLEANTVAAQVVREG